MNEIIQSVDGAYFVSGYFFLTTMAAVSFALGPFLKHFLEKPKKIHYCFTCRKTLKYNNLMACAEKNHDIDETDQNFYEECEDDSELGVGWGGVGHGVNPTPNPPVNPPPNPTLDKKEF